MYYTKEQIEEVKNIDLIEFVKSMNFKFKQERNAYRILDYNGGFYVFNKNQRTSQGFYWHKYNIKGNIIDFCKMIFKESYTDAIKRLLDYKQGIVYSVDTSQENNKKLSVYSVDTLPKNNEKSSVYSVDRNKNFILPERDKEIKQAFAYLLYSRCIDKNLINMCIKEGIIRQFREKNHVYVGFIGKDVNNNTKYLMLRTTLTGSNFKKEYENSNKAFGFKVFNKETVYSVDSKKDIYIFESPIDLLSYMTLNLNKTLKNNVFLSMGGVSSLALEQFINDYKPKIGNINICFDNDDAGQINAIKIKEKISSVYSVDSKNIHILKPIYKDYNEQLKAIINSREQIENINQNKLSRNLK